MVSRQASSSRSPRLPPGWGQWALRGVQFALMRVPPGALRPQGPPRCVVTARSPPSWLQSRALGRGTLRRLFCFDLFYDFSKALIICITFFFFFFSRRSHYGYGTWLPGGPRPGLSLPFARSPSPSSALGAPPPGEAPQKASPLLMLQGKSVHFKESFKVKLIPVTLVNNII